MPLNPSNQDREEFYFRHMDYTGYRREDFLWEIEGHFKDRRTADYVCKDRGGMIEAGETFHEMFVRLTVDDNLLIHEIEVCIDKHPYNKCPCAEILFQKVKGMQIDKGFSKELRRRIPQKLSCTHLHALLMGTASAAFQTLAQVRMMKYFRGTKPDALDTCIAWDSSGEMVQREWPDFYQAPVLEDSPESGES